MAGKRFLYTSINPRRTNSSAKKTTPKIDTKLPLEVGNVVLVIAVAAAAVILIGLVILKYSMQHGNSGNISTTALSQGAETDFAQGNYQAAETKLSQALASNGSDLELLAAMIKNIASEGNLTGDEQNAFTKAKPYIDQALKTGSSNFDVLMAVGYAYETSGQFTTALNYYNKALAINPNSADALFHTGHVLQFLGHTAEANTDFNRAYAIDPKNPEVLTARGNMFVTQGKPQDAFNAFEQAAATPGISVGAKAEALTAAAIVRGSQNNFQYIGEAVKISAEAANTMPNYSPALATYGYDLYLTQPKTDVAFPYLQKAIAANPRIAKNYYTLGTFYRANKDYANAIAYMTNAVAKIDQDNTILDASQRQKTKALYIYELARTYSIGGVSGNTLSLIKQALALDPTLKPVIQKDVIADNLFKDLLTNQEFIQLVKS